MTVIYFRSGPPPRYVRASHYAYTFTKLGSVEAIAGQWWTRYSRRTAFYDNFMSNDKARLPNRNNYLILSKSVKYVAQFSGPKFKRFCRSYIGQYMPPLSLESIGPLYDYFGWDHELD